MLSCRSASFLAVSFLAFVGAAPASAQFGPMEDDVGNTLHAHPELVLDQTTVDLGTVSDEEPKTVKVGFKNNGAGVLNIISLQGSCGCTVPQPAKKEYKPGEGGVIEITYNPHGKRDAQQTTVTVTSNDPIKPTMQIAVKAVVRPTVYFDPPIVAFNQIPEGKGGTMTLKLVGRVDSFAASEVTVSNPDVFTARAVETKPAPQPDGKPGFESTIEVAVKPTAPIGMIQGNLTIRTTAEKHQIVNVQAFAEITGEMIATPQKYYLNVIPVGTDFEGRINLRHRTAGKAFNVKGVKVVPLAGNVTHEATATFTADPAAEGVPENSSYTIVLKGKAPDIQANVQGDVVVETDVPGEETIKIGYYGYAQAKSANQPGGATPFKVNPAGPAAPTK